MKTSVMLETPKYGRLQRAAHKLLAAMALGATLHQVTLTDPRLLNAHHGEHSITMSPAGVGDVIRWSAAGPAPAAASLDIGMGAGGKFLVPTGIDVGAAGTMTIGTTTATGLTLGAAGFKPNVPGGLTTPSVDTVAVGTLTIGGTNANNVTIGGTSALTNCVIAAGTINIGGSVNGPTILIGNGGGAGSAVTITSDGAAGFVLNGNVTLKDNNLLTWLTNVAVAAAVNHVAIANAITGTAPQVQAIGTDANVSLTLNAKGAGAVQALVGTDSVLAFALLDSGGNTYLRGDSTNGRVTIASPNTAAAPRTTLDIQGNTGVQIGGTGQLYVAIFENTGGATTSGAVLFAGGDNSGNSHIMCDFRMAAALGTVVGNIACTNAATTYNSGSDRRMKDNIRDARAGLKELLQVRVRDFTFKHDDSGRIYSGYIAQELQELVPDAVTAPKEGMWSVDYGRLTPLCVRAIQELHERIAILEKKAA